MAKNAKKVTRSDQYLVNLKYLGHEPSFKTSETISDIELSKALSWYHAMATKDAARIYLEDYLNTVSAGEDSLNKFSNCADSMIPLTLCFMAQIIMNGAPVSDEILNKFSYDLNSFLNSIVVKETKSNVISIKDRVKEKTNDLISEIEYFIDTDPEFSLYEYLQKNSIPPAYASSLITKYKPWLEDLVSAFKGDNLQLTEGYFYLSKSELKKKIVFVGKLLEDAHNYANFTKTVSKQTRKPTKPKAISIEKKTKSFSYLKEINNPKIASINPVKVVGSSEVWLFNVSTKAVTVLRSSNPQKLDIKGSSILNFDESKSSTKKLSKDTNEFIKKVLETSKMRVKKEFEEYNTVADLQTSSTKTTIILKVFA